MHHSLLYLQNTQLPSPLQGQCPCHCFTDKRLRDNVFCSHCPISWSPNSHHMLQLPLKLWFLASALAISLEQASSSSKQGKRAAGDCPVLELCPGRQWGWSWSWQLALLTWAHPLAHEGSSDSCLGGEPKSFYAFKTSDSGCGEDAGSGLDFSEYRLRQCTPTLLLLQLLVHKVPVQPSFVCGMCAQLSTWLLPETWQNSLKCMAPSLWPYSLVL